VSRKEIFLRSIEKRNIEARSTKKEINEEEIEFSMKIMFKKVHFPMFERRGKFMGKK
jgi:hypothetical protein